MSYNYNPIPPRVWSRVQAQCTYIVPDSSYNSVYIPITNQTVSLAQAISLEKNLYKGNILQYKNNSSRLTKNQKYSQISKGLWCNRTKVFATQSLTYTNPNTTGLLRVNYTTYPYPNQIVGKPNNISGPFQYNVTNPAGCPTTSVQDGGNLVCGTYVNPCTGNIIQTIPQPELICNSSTASDVPGIPVNLCWSPNFQTFFPRNNLTMSNSLNKWPQGYKGLVSAVTPGPPILSIDASTNTTITLFWTMNSNNCIPISSFNIYQNGVIVQTQPYSISSTTIYGLNNCTSYSFYVTSLSNNIESIPSNIVNISIYYVLPPTIISGTAGNEEATINWIPNLNCATINSYLLYQNGIPSPIQTIPFGTNTTLISGLNNCGTYSFYLVSYNQNYNNYSAPSNTFLIDIQPYPPTLSGNYDQVNIGNINLTWTNIVTCQNIIGWNIYQNGVLTSISNNPSSPTLSYTFSGLTLGSIYSYYIVAVGSNDTLSINSNILSITLPAFYNTTGNYISTYSYINPGYTGVVFNSSNNSQNSTITFNYVINNINVLVVGGGGGGGQTPGNPGTGNAAGGGGGGGGICTSNFNSTVSQYNITVGYGGNSLLNAPAPSANGGQTTFSGNSISLSAPGGACAVNQKTTGGGGGTATGGINNYNGGSGASGIYTGGGSPSPPYGGGGNSGLISINIPTSSGNSNTLYLSGGGGGGNNSSLGVPSGNGGNAGAGYGGATSGSSTVQGGSAVNTFTNNGGYGGGGGGTPGNGNPSDDSGRGGAGVVILWWQTI
jgi:hypothetical protein